MRIENPRTGEYVNIYSARLTFVKEKNEQVRNTVHVTIYYSKTKKEIKDLSIPEDINTNDLNWRKRDNIAVYYLANHKSINDYEYASNGVTISTNLGQWLENLILEACFGKQKYKII